MDLRKVLIALMLIFVVSYVTALSNTTIDTIEGTYTAACAAIEWTYTETTETDWDFNTFNVDTVSNKIGLDVIYDLNTRSNTLVMCTLSDSAYVAVTITPIDTNTDGNFSFIYGTPATVTVTAPPVLNAGSYFIYVLLNTFAGIIGILMMVFVVIFFIYFLWGKKMIDFS